MTKKNKLIQEEINRVKTIMGLTEQMSVDGCIDYLEDLDYNVDDPNEGAQKSEKCMKKPHLKCVLDALKANNIDENKIITRPFPNGECFTMVSNTVERDRMKSGNLTFWSDGRLTYISIFNGNQSMTLENGGTLKIKKFQYDGRYKCDPNTNTITHSYFKFSALRDENNKVQPAHVFTPKKEDGSDLTWTTETFFKKNFNIGEAGDTMKLVKTLI